MQLKSMQVVKYFDPVDDLNVKLSLKFPSQEIYIDRGQFSQILLLACFKVIDFRFPLCFKQSVYNVNYID